MFLIRWISRWPLGLLHASGAALGWLVWALSPTYRRRLRENADLAGVDARARRRAIAETGRMVAETPWLWLHAGDAELSARVRWHEDAEFEVFSAAVTGPGPVIVLTPHMGSFEVAGRAYALRFGAGKPETVLYRPARSRALRELQEAARHRPNMATAPANLAGRLVKALKLWTNQPWLVAAEGGGGAETAWERQKREGRELRAEIEADPFVRSVMEAFPGSEIVEIRNAPAPEAEAPPEEAETEADE